MNRCVDRYTKIHYMHMYRYVGRYWHILYAAWLTNRLYRYIGSWIFINWLIGQNYPQLLNLTIINIMLSHSVSSYPVFCISNLSICLSLSVSELCLSVCIYLSYLYVSAYLLTYLPTISDPFIQPQIHSATQAYIPVHPCSSPSFHLGMIAVEQLITTQWSISANR